LDERGNGVLSLPRSVVVGTTLIHREAVRHACNDGHILGAPRRWPLSDVRPRL